MNGLFTPRLLAAAVATGIAVAVVMRFALGLGSGSGRAASPDRPEAHRSAAVGDERAGAPRKPRAPAARTSPDAAESGPPAPAPASESERAEAPPAAAGVAEPAAVRLAPFGRTLPGDFEDDLPAPHRPDSIRGIGEDLLTWLDLPENSRANASYLGTECPRAPCTIAVEFDTYEDPGFIQRLEKRLAERSGLGTPVLFAAFAKGARQEIQFHWNPAEPGTPEHYAYSESIRERFVAENPPPFSSAPTPENVPLPPPVPPDPATP